MPELKVYTFGPPRLERDGQPIDLGLRKALALIVYLAVTGQPHSRDHLATLLWPESDQREGRGRIRRVLHRLSEALGADVIEADGDTLRVGGGLGLWLDCAAFRAEATAGLPASPAHVDAAPRLARLCAAVELYADDFLAGFTLSDSPDFDEWQFFQRESLRQLYGQVLEQLVQGYRAQEAWSDAIAYARRWVALDRLHEPAHRALMRLYAWSGQHAAAVRQYQECARVLEAELGAEPEEETTGLYESIRARQIGAPEQAAPPAAAPVVSRQLQQQIRFCRAFDGVRIAYATSGAGQPLVKAANWLSHLEFDWNSPVWRHWLAELSRQHTLIRYDERGCGLSDWDVDDFSVDVWVRDLETVVDTLGLERFPLLGISQGGPVALTYAVRHPERVTHLILYGSYALGWQRLNLTAAQRELEEATVALMRGGWGQDNPAFRQLFTTLFMPEATAEQMRWYNDLQRNSTSPENAVRFRTALAQIDVRAEAARVTVPTLILHARNDALIPFEAGRRLASLMPAARFVPLESKNHILLEDEPAWQRFLEEIHGFVSEGGQPAPARVG